jgi:hypothetical protein
MILVYLNFSIFFIFAFKKYLKEDKENKKYLNEDKENSLWKKGR